jgi:Ca2+-binding EF-hand superfamily protein
MLRDLTERNGKHHPVSINKFLKVFGKNNKFSELAKMIKEIDREYTGYVTQTELDDILKILYPKHFANSSLKQIYLPFVSGANKILVDYCKFKRFLIESIPGMLDLIPD